MKTTFTRDGQPLFSTFDTSPFKAGATCEVNGERFMLKSVNVRKTFASGAAAETVVELMPIDDVVFGTDA